MSRELLTPVNRSAKLAVVDLATRRFQKQILPKTEINYSGRTITFDDTYLGNLVDGFRKRAFDQTPFQLADASNTHTNDPERTRGQMVDVVLTADGIDGVFDLTDEGVKVIEANPGLGVSARIIEGLERADGSKFTAAIQHVLGTLDPRIVGMKPWQAVGLSNDNAAVTETIDLSAVVLTTGQEETMTTKEKTPVVVSLTAEQRDALAAGATLELTAPEPEVPGVTPAPKETETKPVEKADEVVEDEDDTEPPDEDDDDEDDKPVALTAAAARAVELANAAATTASAQVLELTRAHRMEKVEREIDKLRHRGLAPALVDLARPLLEMPSQAIELANGTDKVVDPGVVARALLDEFIELANSGHAVLDFTQTGGLEGNDAVQTERALKVDALDEY